MKTQCLMRWLESLWKPVINTTMADQYCKLAGLELAENIDSIIDT